MKKLLTTVVLLTIIFSQVFAQDDISWPRQLTENGSVMTLYQPQVSNWDEYKTINFRIAFSLLPNGATKEVLGVLDMLADTDTDMDTHMVLVDNMSITAANFPTLDSADAESMSVLAKTFVTSSNKLTMPLEQIVASTPKRGSADTITVNNDPPVIFVSTKPTLLIQLEGAPVKGTTGQESLDFIVNSSFPLFYYELNKTYYLYDALEWQTAPAINGPWTFTADLPAPLKKLGKDSNWKNIEGAIPAVNKPDANFPQVYSSEKPAELILFVGKPIWNEIKGTSLKFASNTQSDIFFNSSNDLYYFVTSGRWFSSPSFEGPWIYATPDLPADFLKIPTNSPASSVLAFVPGTEQAKDAVMIAQIPVTKQTNTTEAAKDLKITYSGEPKFDPIQGSTLQYAANTSDKVIEVASNQYFACVDAIWFESSDPTGPWTVATSVPESIYDMPSSSPVYNVTYVTQTVQPNNIVVSSYTSGYNGAYFMGTASGVVVVAGTGFYTPPYYYYPPYGYPVFYPMPVTYGCYAYHPYYYGGVSYHASYNAATGAYGRSATAYGPYGSSTVGQAYNPKTGTYARGQSVSNGYGTASAAHAYNPYTGKNGYTRQESNAGGQYGASTVTGRGGQSASAAHAFTNNGNAGAARTANGNMYAGANGNVYKNTGGGWQDASNPGQSLNRSGNDQSGQFGGDHNSFGGSQGFNSQAMNQEAANRERGNTSAQQFGGGSGGFGGGGFSGGGFGGGGGFNGGGFNGGGGFGGGAGGMRGGGGRR